MADIFTPAVKKLLRKAGRRFERRGKGDHENPVRLADRASVHGRRADQIPTLANHTLRQAGLPKAF